MPGRGAWVHPDLNCLQLAERRTAFGRALRHAGPLDTESLRAAIEVVAVRNRNQEQDSPSPLGPNNDEGSGLTKPMAAR